MRTIIALSACLMLGGCSKAIENFLLHKPIKQAMLIPDLNMICQSANANVSMAAGAHLKKPPLRALAILETTAAVCSELRAMEYQIEAERAWATLDGKARIAEVTDARERERRARAITAGRLERAFGHVEARFGVVGQACPKMRNEEDELTYLLGLISGAAALLQDQASGGAQGVTTDRLRNIARASTCLDDDRWWHVPTALRAGTWAMVPGSGPDGVDGWEALDQAAASGEAKGMRIARAIQTQLAANAGRTDIVERAITAAHLSKEPPPEDFLLFDIQARLTINHQLDLLWIKARGHRSTEPGRLPGRPSVDASPQEDPFGEDPFADDPFADEPSEPSTEESGDAPEADETSESEQEKTP